MYLISDNIDTLTGMRLAGVDGIVVHEREELRCAFDAVLPAASAACTGSPAKSMIPAIKTVLKKKNTFVPMALL